MTSTTTRATYPPRRCGHISSGKSVQPRQQDAQEAYCYRRTWPVGPDDGNPTAWRRRKEWHVTVEQIQLLTPEGERVDNPDYPLGDVDIKDLYRDMVMVRRIDTEAISLQRQGELGLWASLLGQEAAQIGSGRALSPKDMAFPSYREHGVAWCRGLDPMKLLELFRGVSHGSWDPNEHMFHLYTIVIGDQTLHATGYAMGIQRDGADDAAAIAYFGDGATSQGD